MKRHLLIRPQAELDLLEMVEYLARDSLDTARRFEAAAVETFTGLLVFPDAHPAFDLPGVEYLGLRKTAVVGFPNHLIFYRAEDDRVEVQRLIHGHRDLPAVFRGD
ncbi:MAG: type II toxin-antitoxin system RelE/ParE family toxin [Planctomycetota bacterium]